MPEEGRDKPVWMAIHSQYLKSVTSQYHHRFSCAHVPHSAKSIKPPNNNMGAMRTKR